jgi:hypothetical protein
MGFENGKETRPVEEAMATDLAELKHCLAVTIAKSGRPRIACMWAKFYPTWDDKLGLGGGRGG